MAYDVYVAHGAPGSLYPGRFSAVETAVLAVLFIALLLPTFVYTTPIEAFTPKAFATVSSAGFIAILAWYIWLEWLGHRVAPSEIWGILLLVQFMTLASRFNIKSLLPTLVDTLLLTKAERHEAAAQKARTALRSLVGDETFTSWFNAMDFESFDGQTVRVSLPVRFLRDYIERHYMPPLLLAFKEAFPSVRAVDLTVRRFRPPAS